jgi:hypothetical protein
MTQEILKTVGQVAGIGGIGLGVLLLIFREVIRKNIFPNLTRGNSYRLLRLALVLVWSVALAGLAAWVTVSRPALLRSQASSVVTQQTAERGVILIELGYSLYALGLGKKADMPQSDTARVQGDMRNMYARLGITIPSESDTGQMFGTTRSELSDERDRQCLDIGMEMAAAQSLGLLLIHPKGRPYKAIGEQQLHHVAQLLQNELESLGIAEAALKQSTMEQLLTPAEGESLDEYSAMISKLKATIAGAYRRRYGS